MKCYQIFDDGMESNVVFKTKKEAQEYADVLKDENGSEYEVSEIEITKDEFERLTEL